MSSPFRPLYAQMEASWSTMGDRWRRAAARWSDPVQAFMDKEVWSQFSTDVPRALSELRELDELIDRAQRELGR